MRPMFIIAWVESRSVCLWHNFLVSLGWFNACKCSVLWAEAVWSLWLERCLCTVLTSALFMHSFYNLWCWLHCGAYPPPKVMNNLKTACHRNCKKPKRIKHYSDDVMREWGKGLSIISIRVGGLNLKLQSSIGRCPTTVRMDASSTVFIIVVEHFGGLAYTCFNVVELN